MDKLDEAIADPQGLLVRLQAIISTRCQLRPSHLVLAGVSGGPDSLFMLHILWGLGFNLVVAHLDHQLRPESAEEAQSVASLAQNYNLPVVLGSQDVRALSARESLSIEEAARLARYRFLFTEAERRGAQAVVVGHTADDQVETVLMHLLRGSGSAGLTGMAYRSLPSDWSQEIPLVRPLLAIWRSEILAYLDANQLSPLQDPTNLDVRYYRNYLRNELIPYLEMNHPRFRERLWRTSEILSEEDSILRAMTAMVWEQTLLLQGDGYVLLDRQGFLQQPPGIQRRLIRKAIDLLRPGLRDIDYQTTQAAIDFVGAPSRSGQRDLADGLRLFVEGDGLWLSDWSVAIPSGPSKGSPWPQLSPGSEMMIASPGSFSLTRGWTLVVSVDNPRETGFQGIIDNKNPFEAWLDGDKLAFPLVVRSRKPGDRFKPLGMAGHSHKLSDFMINVKLPARARDFWPLVVSRDQVAWVPGYRPADPFKVTQSTRVMVKLALQPSQE